MCRVIQCDSFCSWFIILNVIGLWFTTLGAFILLLGNPPPQGVPLGVLQGCKGVQKEECAPLLAASQNKSKHYNTVREGVQ